MSADLLWWAGLIIHGIWGLFAGIGIAQSLNDCERWYWRRHHRRTDPACVQFSGNMPRRSRGRGCIPCMKDRWLSLFVDAEQ